jgi:PKD repeat protein
LVAPDDQTVYLSGGFSTIGTQSPQPERAGSAAVLTADSSATAWDPAGPASPSAGLGPVRPLAIAPNGLAVYGSVDDRCCGDSAAIEELSPSDAAPTSWDPQFALAYAQSGVFDTVAVTPDSKHVFVCGGIGGVDGTAQTGIAEFSPQTAGSTAPIARTGVASLTSATTATLHGSVDPNGEDTTYYFEYGEAVTYGARTATQDAGSSSSQAVSAGLSGLTPGATYHFRLVAKNDAGTTVGADATFTSTPPPVNSTPPTITGPPEEGQTLDESNGSWSNAPTGYHYQWLACDLAGTDCSAISGATSQTFVPSAAQAGSTLEVQEIASNAGGTGAAATSPPTTPVTGLPLKANAGEILAGTPGVPIAFDGTGSTPGGDIGGYHWDFGDGTSADGAMVNHAYASAGSYTATLTVSWAGASHSATTTVTVAAPAAQTPAVTIQDTGGHPIAGAQVLYISPSGTRTSAIAGGDGVARLAGLPDGTDTVYAYQSGYQPAAGQITVSGGAGQATITLQSGTVATSTLDSHQMTLQEIQAAGIDASDPDNQVVFDFQINLNFGGPDGTPQTIGLSCHVNSAGQFVGGCGPSTTGGPDGDGAGGDGGGWVCSPGGCQSPQASVTGQVVDGHPLIQWLILRGKAAVLKQFFDVSMVVTNLSPEPFDLTGGQATLNVPSGMSLAPTAAPQSGTQTVPTIAGDSSSETDWVIRGDTPGSYTLSAEYDGTLQPFGDPVSLIASVAQPLRVWGVDALSLSVQADSGSLRAGYPYHVRLGLTNNADVPVYDVSMGLDPNTHPQYIFQPDERFSDQVAEIDPGQTLYSHTYIVVPDADSLGAFNPALSSATFAGQTPIAGAGISAVTPPPVYSLTSLGDAPGFVHLQWQAVPGAGGYEVFSTSDRDTPFGAAPLQAAESPAAGAVVTLPASATDAYLPATQGAFYAVSSIVGGEPTMEHPLIAAQRGANPGPPPPPPPPDLDLALTGPSTSIAGQVALVTAHVDNHAGIPAANVAVSFEVTGASGGTTGECEPVASSCLTDGTGFARFAYRSKHVGSDTVVAWIDLNGDRRLSSGEPHASFAVTWRSPPGDTAYVAMGDSYSAGEGLGKPYEAGTDDLFAPSPNQCHRNVGAYGPQLSRARLYGIANLTFVACSGAETDDFFHPNVMNGGEPPQLDRIGPATKTITLTIGGNDLGFVHVLTSCITGPGAHGKAGCTNSKTLRRDAADRLSVLTGTRPDRAGGATIRTQEGRPIWSLPTILKRLHAAAPQAHIFFAGYPHLFGEPSHIRTGGPDSPLAYCALDGVHGVIGHEIANEDVQWINLITDELDLTIKRAVAGAQASHIPATFVDVVPEFTHHGLCDKSSSWINGVEIDTHGLNTIYSGYSVKPESFHPTHAGQTRGYAAAFRAAGVGS